MRLNNFLWEISENPLPDLFEKSVICSGIDVTIICLARITKK